MLADTAPVIAMNLWIDAHPALALAIYLGTGFIVGILSIMDGKCESPIGTLAFATFAGFLMIIVGVVIGAVLAPFALIVWLLGIKSSQGDTRGV